MKTKNHKSLATSFLLMIFIPFFFTFFEMKEGASLEENRTLAPLPPIQQFFKKNYLPRLSDYLSDHFGLRSQFLNLGNLQVKIFNSPHSRGVLIGKEGWLFFTGDSNLDDYRNAQPLNEEELQRWVDYIRECDRRAKKTGSRYVFMIGPNAHTIYGDRFLPDWVTKKGSLSRFDQIIEALRPHRISVVDPRAALLEKRDERQLYFKTDTHWSPEGAYIGYRVLIEYLGLKPIPYSGLSRKPRLETRMDLARTVGSLPIPEHFTQLTPFPSKMIASIENDSPIREIRVTCRDCSNLSVMMYRDSFTTALVPFLNQHFKSIRYIWTNDLDWNEIAKERPDIIIDQRVERRLMHGAPKLE